MSENIEVKKYERKVSLVLEYAEEAVDTATMEKIKD